MENTNEIWQTSVNGEIYETDFAGLIEWIAEGSLLPEDKVRKGNLRWIEANKVPALHRFFNARQLESTNQVVTSTNVQNATPPPQVQNFNVNSPQPVAQTFQAPPPPTFYKDITPETERKFCAIHTDANAKYHCETCGNYFCKACPTNAVCPMCGAACKTIEVPIVNQPVIHQPLPQVNPNQEVFIDEDVRKGSSWFFWKAGFTLVNAFLIIAGAYWQFSLGLAMPEFIHGFLIGLTDMPIEEGLKSFHGVVLFIALIGSAITGFIGYQARKAQKWAFVLGMIIFSFDGILCLVTFSFIGAILHAYAIYTMSKGYSSCQSS